MERKKRIRDRNTGQQGRQSARPTTCKSLSKLALYATVIVTTLLLSILCIAQIDLKQPPALVNEATVLESSSMEPPIIEPTTILPPLSMRPSVQVNIRDWTRRLSEDVRAVGNRVNCVQKIRAAYDNEAKQETFNPTEVRDRIVTQISQLLAQHKAALNAIVDEAERLMFSHNFVKNLRINYTDVHRLRNELDSQDTITGIPDLTSGGGIGQSPFGAGQGFTSIGGGTPVPGPPEWQTPIKNIVLRTSKNFEEYPVNTSMSAVHLPFPIYPGQPNIMNGIAWSEKLDQVFKRNLAQYAHVHHQYYGDRLGFLRTFPAHKWRIQRTEPDMFDARTRTWYVAGASAPKDVVILVDTSGSMTGLRREIAKGVVFEILDTLTSNDYFTVLRFSESVSPVGLPKCNLKQPKLTPAIQELCSRDKIPVDKRELCINFQRQWDRRNEYLRDHPNIIPDTNGSYISDDSYQQSIVNITSDIGDAYLLPATSRNIRYLKSNFSMPTAGIANFTNALMAAFELLQAYNRTGDQGAQCNQAIMLITDGAIKSSDDVFNRYNYPGSPVRVFSYMIGREVGDITHTKSMACRNRGYYAHVINLSEVREQVQKYLPVLARPLVLAKHHPITWTHAYGDETYQVLTDWVLEIKRRERARIMLNEEIKRLNEQVNSNDTIMINIELTNIPEYDELPQVDEQLRNRIICEDNDDDPAAMDQSLHEEIDPLGYNDLACHWTTRRADLLTSVAKPVFDMHNTSLYFERVLHKNIWTEKETHVRNAQLLGVAAIDLRIADIMKVAPSHLLGPSGYAILINHNGFILHHPDFRALLEDPFDKQSKILKPYFSAVDLTHIEQVYIENELDFHRKRKEENKLFSLRDAAVRRRTGTETFAIKRAIDCGRRLYFREQTFYYAPIKDSPFTFMLALPQGYGLNRLAARKQLSSETITHFKPSDYDLWTVHPEYRYCEDVSLSPSTAQNEISSVSILLDVIEMAAAGNIDNKITYDDLRSLNIVTSATARQNIDRRGHVGSAASGAHRFICDKDLFPSLLFDGAATYQHPESICRDTCDQTSRSSFLGQYGSRGRNKDDESCSAEAEEMRTTLTQIYGLEMSFVATRSGLTRVRVTDLGPRIKKLADLFIQRHNRAMDEPWYGRTVEWNMRMGDDSTLIFVPYNAYIRLIAKLRQRITQRHPAINNTRANCDPLLMAEEAADIDPTASSSSTTSEALADPSVSTPLNAQESKSMQNDDPNVIISNGTSDQTSASNSSAEDLYPPEPIDYSEYSSFDFLDLLANSSVHVVATQTAMVNPQSTTGRSSKTRTPVAVSGLLYDYATFARRFLNGTSLEIRNLDPTQIGVKVDICPNGDCPTKCGMRNDTIDCLLVDNNGFIVVGEELPYIGRSLTEYDNRLMESLVASKVFHQVSVIDYQAICPRSDQTDQKPTSGPTIPSVAPQTSAAGLSFDIDPFKWNFLRTFAFNLASSILWIVSRLYSVLFIKSALPDIYIEDSNSFFGQLAQWQRSAIMADAQSSTVNQSLLALLPNKTYLRPCEKINILYETRLDKNHPERMSKDTPEYYATRCNCSGWYVYDVVPKTNLIMLIVNTTSSCRRCEADMTGDRQTPNNYLPVVATTIIDPSTGSLMPSGAGNGYSGANKAAEDAVCTMLERDSQLYVQKMGSCLESHPEESSIHLCGAADRSVKINWLLLWITFCMAFAVQSSYFYAQTIESRSN